MLNQYINGEKRIEFVNLNPVSCSSFIHDIGQTMKFLCALLSITLFFSTNSNAHPGSTNHDHTPSYFQIDGHDTTYIELCPNKPAIVNVTNLTDPFFVSLQESDSSWEGSGIEDMSWFHAGNYPSYINGSHFDLFEYARERNFEIKEGGIYQLKLAASPWHSTSKLIQVKTACECGGGFPGEPEPIKLNYTEESTCSINSYMVGQKAVLDVASGMVAEVIDACTIEIDNFTTQLSAGGDIQSIIMDTADGLVFFYTHDKCIANKKVRIKVSPFPSLPSSSGVMYGFYTGNLFDYFE